MSSQPIEYSKKYDDIPVSFSQGAIDDMTEAEKNEKREQLVEYLTNLGIDKNWLNVDSEINDGGIKIDIPTTKHKHFLYFIGRANPPHDGHIKTIVTMINEAKARDTIPLILLGSGPGRIRTLDNPIPFSVKAQFIEEKLADIGIFPESYRVIEMESPAKQIAEYVTSAGDIAYDEITVTLVAGNKEKDASGKLNFTLNAAEQAAKITWEKAKLNIKTHPVEPTYSTSDSPDSNASAMSATKVRKSVYSNYIQDKPFEEWNEQYISFYGDNAETMYRSILEPALSLDKRIVNFYIENGKLPTKTETKQLLESSYNTQSASNNSNRAKTYKASKTVKMKNGGGKKLFTHKNKKQMKYNKTKYRTKKRTLRKCK